MNKTGVVANYTLPGGAVMQFNIMGFQGTGYFYYDVPELKKSLNKFEMCDVVHSNDSDGDVYYVQLKQIGTE